MLLNEARVDLPAPEGAAPEHRTKQRDGRLDVADNVLIEGAYHGRDGLLASLCMDDDLAVRRALER